MSPKNGKNEQLLDVLSVTLVDTLSFKNLNDGVLREL